MASERDLTADERKELEALRTRLGHRQTVRGVLGCVLIVIGCVLAPISIVAIWSDNQISNTDRYVETMAPLASSPSIQNAVANRVTAEVNKQLDVAGLWRSAVGELEHIGLPDKLGGRLDGLGGPISSGVNGFVHDKTLEFVRSPAFARLWRNLNQKAHTQLVGILSGNGTAAVKVHGDTVSLDLGPVIAQVKQRLVNAGLGIANAIPAVHPTFQLFQSEQLVKAQNGYKLLNTLRWVLPILSLLLIAAGVFAARRRRRALSLAGLGVATAMLVLALGLLIGRSIFLDKVAAGGLDTAAAQDMFDTVVRFLRAGLRTVLVVGLVVAAGLFLAGPSAVATRARDGAGGALRWVRGDRFGSTWVYRYRVALRATAVAIAVLIFLFWDRPTGLGVLILALCVLGVVLLIELIGRPKKALAG